ncbi:hypothetical protein Enr13x_72480 [Stieleria neptunia]|uniref:GxxExxY protein n=2 Tax=Stieleria neptunia TaxID=2527979 RepID=A0A518I2J7_9BACT|nr:hypothetical protein Enr13x_72480 [Stieleria neptunia]
MPITCPIDFHPLSTEEFATLDYTVMAHAFSSQRDLGSLADEIIYQSDFFERLDGSGFNVAREVPVLVRFESFSKTYKLDLVVNDMAVYELKTVAELTKEHLGQLLNYLLLLDIERGKLVNFRPNSVDSKFVNSPLSGSSRRCFSTTKERYHGPQSLVDLIEALLSDWGTGLELPLYQQAIVHLLGGREQESVKLPMNRRGRELGNQRFHLVTADSAFRLTAFSKFPRGYSSQLSRLLRASPLDALHWINIDYHEVTMTTIQR